MPATAAASAHAPVQVALTGRLTKPAAPQVPGGLASPWAPAGSAVVHIAPPTQPLVAPVVPEVQNDRSPCLAASIATVTMPAAAKLLATVSMSARPPRSPWRNTTSGAHFPSGVRS